MNPGIAYNVAVQFFLSTPYEAIKNSWLVVLTLIVTSHSQKIYLHQFAIVLNMFGNTLGNKSNIYEGDWSKFD